MLPEKEVVSTIMWFASYCGDPTPSAIRYVRGTRGDLNRIMGAELFGEDAATPAVLVEATGNFTWRHSAPYGHSGVSSGTTITLVINEATGEAVDKGIRNKQYDWSALGPVHYPAVPT